MVRHTLCLVVLFISISTAECQNLPLPPLPYSYSALEPFYSSAQLELHHSKHLQTYTNNLNAALTKLRDSDSNGRALANKGIDYILQHLDDVPSDLRNSLRNNGGGYVNHQFFFDCLAPNAVAQVQQQLPPAAVPAPLPIGESSRLILATFGSFDDFMSAFSASALAVFGSGWTWLIIDRTAKLSIRNTANQDLPSNTEHDLYALLVIDVWEHAYYKDYENRRSEYVQYFWKIVNWQFVEMKYQQWKTQKVYENAATLLEQSQHSAVDTKSGMTHNKNILHPSLG